MTKSWSWRDDATETLIKRRRLLQSLFATTRIQDQGSFWETISQDIMRAHPGFTVTAIQCRRKFNALVHGYKNFNHSPSRHDEMFQNELSDQFWLGDDNYLLFN